MNPPEVFDFRLQKSSNSFWFTTCIFSITAASNELMSIPLGVAGPCRADVVWPPRSCDLTPLDYYLWGDVKDKYYPDKPATIDALKDNISEAIGEIRCTQSIMFLKIGPIV